MVRFITVIGLLFGLMFQNYAQEDELNNRLYDSLWHYWNRGETDILLRLSDSIICNYPNENTLLAKVYLLMGRTSSDHGDVHGAFNNYYQTLRYNSDSFTNALAYSNLSYLAIDIGDFTKAIDYSNLAQLIYPEDYPDYIADNYNNMGYVFTMIGEWEQSLKYYKKSAEILHNNNIPPSKYYYMNCAYSYMKMGKLDSAKIFYNEAFNINLPSEYATINYLNYAELLNKLNRPKEEQEQYNNKAYQESLKLSEDHIYRYRCLLDIGKYFVKTNNCKQALSYLNQAKHTKANATKDLNRIELYHAYARAYEGLARENNSTGTLETALNYLDTALYQVRDMCNSIISEESILKLLEVQNGLYKTGLRIAYSLFKQSGNRYHAAKAFQYAEREKYGVLTLSHNRNEAVRAVSIPDSLLFLQAQLKTSLANMRFELDKNKTGNRDSLLGQIFTTSERLEALIKHIETVCPDYRKFKYLDKPVQIKAVQDYLRPRQVLMEYALHDTVGYAFIVCSDTFCVRRFNTDSTFYANLALYKKVLHREQASDFEQYKKSARYLYDALVLPYKKLIGTNSELVIVPDIGLGSISFDALLTRDYEPVPMIIYKTEEPYLIRDHALSYAYSAGSLMAAKNRKYPFWRQMISFTPDYTGSPDSLVSVLSTLEYSKKADRWFFGKSVAGKRATESRFKKDNRYGVINFYAHGEDKDGKSFIYLCPDDSLNDSYLYTHEVNTMRINANLIALVACYSGRGESVRGEGLLSMGRSFTLSGSASVISSLWAAASDPSMQIMKEFYKQIRLGKNKARAMQIAKLKFLEETDTVQAHPQMWSGIVIFGNTESLFNPFLGCAIVLFLIVLMLFLVRRIFSN